MSERKLWKELGHETPEAPRNPRSYVWCEPLQSWLEPFPDKDWPEPRDTKTDPPNEKDGGHVLFWTNEGWRVRQIPLAGYHKYWLPMPPAPTPLKSAAEAAWDEHCASTGPNPALNEVVRFHFYQGFVAGQKGVMK